MNDHKINIQSIIDKRDEKTVKMLKLDELFRLVEKVEEKEDFELNRQVVSIIKLLNENAELKGFYKKHYKKQYQALKAYARKQFGFLARGTLLGEHMALGIGAGVVFGALLVSVNAAFIGVGIALGVAFGVTTGSSKEKAEDEKGNLY